MSLLTTLRCRALSRGFAALLALVAAGCMAAAQARAAGGITEYPLSQPSTFPLQITEGPDGKLWFTESGGMGFGPSAIGQITPTGTVTQFSLPAVAGGWADADGITAGPDGNLWFTEHLGNQIGRITPAGVITLFPAPVGASNVGQGPGGIVTGADGNLWYSAYDAIGKMTTSGSATAYPVGPLPWYTPVAVALGPDGNVWFTEQESNAQIGDITPSGTVNQFHLTSGFPSGIVAGPDGNLWVAAGASEIDRVTPSGVSTPFTTPTTDSNPAFLVVGPDGNVWFTEFSANKIGRITPDGTVTEYPIPTPNSGPDGITAGPDGTLWFTETNADQVAEIVFGPASIASGDTANLVAGQSGSVTVTTTGFPWPSITDGSSTLPQGMTFTDNGNGTATLSGTPTAAAAGTYTVTLTASNSEGPDATQTLTLDVAPPNPTATTTTTTPTSTTQTSTTPTSTTPTSTTQTSTTPTTIVPPTSARRPRCATASDAAAGKQFGALQLGMTEAAATAAYMRVSGAGAVRDFFCDGASGLRAGFATAKLLRAVGRAHLGQLSGRIVWISTTGAGYAIEGVHVGESTKRVRHTLLPGRPVRSGASEWYVRTGSSAATLLMVRGGVVREIAIADGRLAGSRAAQEALVRAFA